MGTEAVRNTVFRQTGRCGMLDLICRGLRRAALKYVARTNRIRLQKALAKESRPIRRINGSEMYLDATVDYGLCTYLLVAGRRESYITDTMAKELLNAKVVIDVGANIGSYALMEARVMGSQGTVYAIEPVPETLDLLEENIELNGYDNIEIANLAIGDKEGPAKMYVGKWLNRSQLAEVGTIVNDLVSREIETQVATLDNFLEDKPFPDIIRMDVEGYEYNIFKGMRRILGTQHELRIFMEFHFRWLGEAKTSDLLKTIKSFGFEIGDLTFEVDEKCVTHSQLLENIASYLNSKVTRVPRKGHLIWNIDEILSNAEVWKGEGARDLCMKMGTLEIMFKREEDWSRKGNSVADRSA